MRYNITVSGTLDTWADEDTVRRDFPMFVRDLEQVHPGIQAGTVTLVSVELLPEPEPEPEPTVEVDTDAVGGILAALNALNARLDRAGL